MELLLLFTPCASKQPPTSDPPCLLPQGYGYETVDANTYAAWNVSYLKYDNCNNQVRLSHLRFAIKLSISVAACPFDGPLYLTDISITLFTAPCRTLTPTCATAACRTRLTPLVTPSSSVPASGARVRGSKQHRVLMCHSFIYVIHDTQSWAPPINPSPSLFVAGNPWLWMQPYANSWRIDDDISASWDR